MSECLWCDAPTDEKLCRSCRAGNDHPLFHCKVPGHIPTLGKSCAECDLQAQAIARRAAANAPSLVALRSIREGLIADWHKPWPGCEHGKAILGMAIDRAIKDLE